VTNATEPMRIWKTGERVEIAFDGRVVFGTVMLASTNGRSIMLGFEALVGGYVGMMPIMWCDADEEFRDLIQGLPVVLKPVGN
jgi:hypothetical protein